MKKLLFLTLLCIAAATPTPAPAPTPDLSTITAADIEATIAHRNALHEQLIQQTLPAATQDVKDAVAKAQVIQKDIDKLALAAAEVPVLEAELKKAHKAIWRDLFIGVASGIAVGVLGVLIGPKLLEMGI